MIATVTLLLVSISSNAGAKELQWRRGHIPAAKPAPKAPSKRPPERAKGVNPLRRDSSVRLAAFEDDGSSLKLSDASAGRATLRSVVVDRQEFEPIRSAQLPTDDTADTQAPPNGTEQFEEQIRAPFGELPEEQPEPDAEQPPTEIPGIDEPLDVEGLDLPEEPMTQPGAVERAPIDLAPQPQLEPLEPLPTFQPLDDDRLPGVFDEEPPPTDAATLVEEGLEMQEICSEELNDLRTSTLADVELSIVVRGTEGQDYPFECLIDDGTWHPGRCWDPTTYMWKASALCHKPLYFEDVALERYGHSWGPHLDPLVSGAHFFTRLPVLPYCMGVTPPNECVYALGHYRPGSCAPYMIPAVPISGRGALFQAGATVGTVFVLP